MQHAAPLSLSLLLVWLAAPALAQSSAYTRHDYEKCAVAPGVASDGVTNRICTGAASIPVRWSSDDDSSSIEIGAAPIDERLGLGSFFEVEKTIEWRTPAGASRPIAAIVRYAVGANVGKFNRSPLVVYRLEPSGRSCIHGYCPLGERQRQGAGAGG